MRKTTLTVVSFNIRFDNPADGKHRWEKRRPMAANFVNRVTPDILATQEGKRKQIEDFADSLTTLRHANSERPWIAERMYPCIFYNPRALQVIKSGDIWLSKTPEVAGSLDFDSSFPRLTTWTLFRHRPSQNSILATNTHLDHVRAETRRRQIKVFIEQLGPLLKGDPRLLLCGDFNESPAGDVRSELDTRLPRLRDPWYKFGKSEESSFHKFKGKLPLADGGARIDWILADERLSPLSIEIDKTCQNGLYPSDHFPIVAEFSL